MNPRLVFAKTPAGDDALRQGARLVQRNMRMVLLQVDGQLTVGELSNKIGNAELVESALLELENAGYIVASLEASAAAFGEGFEDDGEAFSAPSAGTGGSHGYGLSQFSNFDPVSLIPDNPDRPLDANTTEAFPDTQVLASQKATAAKSAEPEPQLPVVEESSPSAPSGSWLGKLLALALLLLVAGVSALFFYPYGNYKPAVENVLARYLGDEVAVDKVSMAFFPEPRLHIQGVRFGGDSSIEQILVSSPFSLTGSHAGQTVIPMVEVVGARLSQRSFMQNEWFMPDIEPDEAFLLRKLKLTRFRVELANEFHLGDFDGEMLLNETGGFDKAVLSSADRKLKIEAVRQSDAWSLAVEGREWKPEGFPVSFGLLETRILLREGAMQINDLDTSVLGGLLKGNWQLQWNAAGLALNGNFSAIRLDSRQMTMVFMPQLKLEGDFSASGKLQARAVSWPQLWDGLEAQFDIDMASGVLTGVDPIDAARRPDTEVRAGATRFQTLQAAAQLNPKQLVLRNIRLGAGVVTGQGQGVATRAGQVEAQMDVAVQTAASIQHSLVRIYGTLPELVAVTRK